MVERFIALFDILGFRNLLSKYPLDEVSRLLNDGLDASLDAVLRAPSSLGNDSRISTEAREVTTAMQARGTVCRTLQFSDSILLYSDGTQKLELWAIIVASVSLLARCARMGILLRGAITLGELEVDQSRKRALGRGLVRAYDLEQQQEWCGAIVDDDVIRHLGSTPMPLAMLVALGLAIPYLVPLRTGKVDSYLAVGWPGQLDVPPAEVRQVLESKLKADDWKARRKIDATTRFVAYYHAYQAGESKWDFIQQSNLPSELIEFLREVARDLQAEASEEA